ncbi:palmitoyltransferase ZDHHC23-like [Haliotis rufescens]|uniref:palmitoyltransferase ZDHHC23-like n=1 Tax=Haliotis rufescens TaxID=6454 RepID=UPI00201F4CE8|nr:palmitoyltransferase ZDHHC23-like [Haliotis rufescens]
MTPAQPTDFNALCCCEYENAGGEKSHILACCCDCQAVDEAADRCITCRPVSNSTMQQIVSTLVDRCRFPWCSGKGAVKIRMDTITPIVMVPVCLLIGTISFVATVAMLMFMPMFMLTFYVVWKRTGNHQTQFFFLWGCTSVVFCFLIFIVCVIPFREILLWEILLLSTSVLLMFYYLSKVRRNPGRLKIQVLRQREVKTRYLPNGDGRRENGDVGIKMNGTGQNMYNEIPNPMSTVMEDTGLSAQQVTWVDSRPIKEGHLQMQCNDCSTRRPPRSGHCTVCKSCISVRDHHCVWVDNCIGANNHRSFLAAMLLFIFCGCYGSHLTLTTVCTPEMYLDWFLLPSDCRFLYGEFQTALCFVSVCYTILSTTIMAVGLFHQVILISQNLTSQELHQAATRGMTRMGLFAVNNVNNHGFIRNWVEFLLSHGRKASPTIPS